MLPCFDVFHWSCFKGRAKRKVRENLDHCVCGIKYKEMVKALRNYIQDCVNPGDKLLDKEKPI